MIRNTSKTSSSQNKIGNTHEKTHEKTLEIAKKLISFPSVTPADNGALLYLADVLKNIGFSCSILPFGSGEHRILNLFAHKRKGKGKHFCFAGHTDVVPAIEKDLWINKNPFQPFIRKGRLYGRGAVDMKGAIAAIINALHNFFPQNGQVSLLITGDEEGSAINGTAKVLPYLKQKNLVPDHCLVGEPTCQNKLGDTIKIGRRGNINAVLKITGIGGHSAYPHKLKNPINIILNILKNLSDNKFDEGDENFPPSSLAITEINAFSGAANVVPETANAKFNIRFNTNFTAHKLEQYLQKIIETYKQDYASDLTLDFTCEPFINTDSFLPLIIKKIIKKTTRVDAVFDNGGGTSDARFISQYCPCAEFGAVNHSMHQVNENANIDELIQLSDIYLNIMKLYFQNDD